MRKKQILFDALFDKRTPAGNATKKKGRSNELDIRRNELLCARYIYHKTYTPELQSYELLLQQLSAEFFITSATIVNLLQNNTCLLDEYKQANLSRQELAKKWNHLNW